MIAALYVQKNGCYFGLDGVDPWDEERDARKYDGPHAVVAHPPCERWGRYWYGGPSCKTRKVRGDDNGCFAAALAAVRAHGGVLEHPEASSAWAAFGLNKPPRHGGWVQADGDIGAPIGWTCCVEQGAYGHRARKATWLYAVGTELPVLNWKGGGSFIRLDEGFHSKEERRKHQKMGVVSRLRKAERAATPLPFREVLMTMARSVHPG